MQGGGDKEVVLVRVEFCRCDGGGVGVDWGSCGMLRVQRAWVWLQDGDATRLLLKVYREVYRCVLEDILGATK